MFQKILHEYSKRFREMLLKIPGNAIKDSRNVQEDSGDVRKDSDECSGRFWGMLLILNQSKPRFT